MRAQLKQTPHIQRKNEGQHGEDRRHRFDDMRILFGHKKHEQKRPEQRGVSHDR